MKRTLIILGIALAAAGCPTPPPIPPPAPSNPPKMTGPKMLVQRGAASGERSTQAASHESPVSLQIDVYQLVVPQRTISHNEAFWKRVDEQAVDVATYDLLLKNGVRVGVAPVAEWDRFRELMERTPAQTKLNTMVGATGKPMELPMRKEVRTQHIFYFDKSNQMQGRTYDESANIVTMTVQSAPRKTDTLRIALCPVVRGMRKQLQYSAMNNELGEVAYAVPERLYDMNLCADVPVNTFLIVAPSPQATWPSSIGNSFFVADGTAERMETVLLIVPKAVRFEPTR
jgi:hypothetical protein